MNSKALLGFCITLAFVSMPIAFLLNPQLQPADNAPFVGYRAEFIGQDVAEVGELVRFLAEGEIVRWECLPKTSDSESYGEHNENYVVSFRKPGTYTVIAAIYVEGELTIHTQDVTVEGPPEPPPPPVVVPDPEIEAKVVDKVKSWVAKYQVEKELCLALAANFDAVAREIKAKDLITPGQIINRTAELNSDLTLNEGLMAELQAYLTSQADVGNLVTAEEHLVVWNSISKGLKDAAN
jgi:hypothetical protein